MATGQETEAILVTSEDLQAQETREAAERVEQLRNETNLMREVLRAVNNGEPVQIPSDVAQYYGNIRENESEIQQTEERFSPDVLQAALAEKAGEIVVDLAESFARVAEAPGTTFGVAEKLLAAHIEEQLRAGADHINLTQSYLTEDPKAAEGRHALALNNLLPLIEEAQKQGISFDEGNALFAGNKIREVIAVRPHQEADQKFSVTM